MPTAEEEAYAAYLDAVARNRKMSSDYATGAIDPWTGRPVEYNARAAKNAANEEQLSYQNYLTAHYQAVGGVQTSTGGGGEATGKSKTYGDNPIPLSANAAPGDIPSWQGSTKTVSTTTSPPSQSYTDLKYGEGVKNPITGVTVYENIKTSPDYVPFSSPVAQGISAQLIREGAVISEQQAVFLNSIYSEAYINSLPKPFMNREQVIDLPGPLGTQVTSLAKPGTFENGVFVPSKAGGRKEPAPMTFGPVGNPLLEFGLVSSKIVDDAFSSLQGAIPSGMMGSPIKAGLGFVEMIPQTLTFIPLVGGAAFMFGQQPSATLASAPSFLTETATGMYTRAIEQPERTAGNIVGMYYAPKIIGTFGEAAYSRSPVGISIAEIGSSSGATSKVLFAYTKGVFAPMETANIRGYVGLKSMSEPAMLQSSKSLVMTNTGIKINTGKIPYSSSVQAVRAELDALAGQQNAFLHGSNEIRFSQDFLSSGKFVVAPEKPLFFAAEPNTVIKRFIQGGTDVQPGSATLLRLIEKPQSVSDALKFGGTAENPLLPKGLYPGTKPITGVSYKGMLQQELIVPAGTEMSATGVGFIETGGSRVTVIDVKIGPANIFEKIGFNLQKAEYKLNALELPQAGFGKPTSFMKSLDIQMTNPLEEVASRQWSPSQKAVMYPYMKEMSKEMGSSAGLRTSISGIEAMPILRETQFVQRELVGEILVGKDLSRSAIGDIYASRMAMGKDVVGGGSTTIRANLGKGFFDESLIGDIDAWARANRVKGMWEAERTIIEKEIPDVMVASRKIEGATTFLDLKVGKAAQGKFPVGAISKPGSPKPIVEIHSIEQFPHVEKPANIGTMKAVGGTKTTGMTTRFLGERKASAIFTNMYLEQVPGGNLEILPSPANIKHGVGASAIAREAASLQYGRDAALTGMTPSYVKGMKLERFAASMDEMLAETTGASKAEVLKYQKGIAQNPLDLPVTQFLKQKAYAKSGLAPVSEILGVGFNVGKREVTQSYPRNPSYPKPTDYGSPAGLIMATSYGLRPLETVYPATAGSQSFTPFYPNEITKMVSEPKYPSVTQSIEKTISVAYPGVPETNKGEYPQGVPAILRNPDVTTPYNPTTPYPTSTKPYPDEYKPTSRQPPGGVPYLQPRSASRIEEAIIGEIKRIPTIPRSSKLENPESKLFRRKKKVWQYTNKIAADFLIAGKEGKPFRHINIHKNNFKKFKM